MSNNNIELNGRTYDTRTGKIVSDNFGKHSRQPQPKGVHMDGFVRPRKTAPRSNPATVNTKNKTPQKSQALMRHAVNKPQKPATSKNEDTRQAPTLSKRPFINMSRLERAAATAKSAAVQKFSAGSIASAPSPSVKSDEKSTPAKESRPQPQPRVEKNVPDQSKQEQSFTQRALQGAQSHEEEAVEPEKFLDKAASKLRVQPKTLRLTLSGLALIAGAGLIVQLSVPRLTMQLAATRAGITASLPEYKPSGFTLSSTVDYRPGHVSINYSSVSDNRSFRVSQTESDWTSDALLKNFVEEKGLYQTIPDKGKTIYMYDGGNATWVDGGIWYSIEGASSLNSDQLLKIANSL